MSSFSPIDVQKALRGVNYPADRDDLAEAARSNGADDALVQRISGLDQKNFDGPNEVSKALFKDG
ncbi:DUF2795 domain-containing protein [Kitasatospora sp. NPDC048194]|uniref:DUF2795 domain-containing protein n=1 Tax=Kitasatospora sp. NPDC048194 TaxID=3364045 RepID=UPI00370F7797